MQLLVILLDNAELEVTEGRICATSQVHLEDSFPPGSVFKGASDTWTGCSGLENPFQRD